MRTCLHCLIFLCCLTSIGRASWAQATEPKLLAKIPFRQLTGGVILLDAKLHGMADTLHFLFDTGSGGISLDSETVHRLHLPRVPSNVTIRGIAGTHPVDFVHDLSLDLPGFRIDSLLFHVSDYTLLSSVYGEKIDGVMGYAILSRFVVKIDFDSLLFSFYAKGGCPYPPGGYMLKPHIVKLPIQEARARDAKDLPLKFLFDMGAGLNLLFSRKFVQNTPLFHKKRKFYPKLAQGVGGEVQMELTILKEFRLGPYRFRNIPTYIFEDEHNVIGYPQLSGLIGIDLLRRFNHILDYEKKEFYLIPNSHFTDGFDYAYSGMELIVKKGIIFVSQVVANSPAEKAGIKEGDEIISIGRGFPMSLAYCRWQLQKIGKRLPIKIKREGKILEMRCTVERIKTR